MSGQRTKVKICGITTLEDAQTAIEAGADMLGFNFYRESVRYVPPELAREIVAELRGTVECVGVFVNEPQPRAVVEIVKAVGLETAQLHGDEPPEYCAEVQRSCGVIKALRVGDQFRPDSIRPFERVLLDAATPEFGGSGKTFDWKIAAEVREHAREVILAGGLNAHNVAEAIAIAKPHAVDACSGLEYKPGQKDRDKIMAFVAAVRAADEQRKAKVLSV